MARHTEAEQPYSTAVSAAGLFRVLGDQTRLRILLLLTGGELSVGDVQKSMRIPQPTVSHHLQLLKRVGLVAARREGRHVFYRLHGAARSAGDGAVKIESAALTLCILGAAEPAPSRHAVAN